jgi:DNA-binding MarR family transcriptional regulator
MTDKRATNELLDLILMVSLIVRDKVKLQSAKHQLSIIHLWMLRFVAENTNPTMRDIATFLNISAPSATSFVETLIKNGFLLRQVDEQDRRVVRIVLSPAGSKLYADIMEGVRIKVSDLIENLNPKEQHGLNQALSALAKRNKD